MFTKTLFLLGFVILHLLLGVAQALGQQPTKPIALGKLETGTLARDSPPFTYGFTARENLQIEIEVLVADGDLIPRISMSQNGTILQTWDAAPGELSYKVKYAFNTPGQYVIGISNIDHTSGIFVLTIRETQDAALTPLSFDTPVNASVARGETIRYMIQADATANTMISVEINNLTLSVSARLLAADDKTIGMVGQDLEGGSFRIPSGGEQYVLEVTNSNSGSVPIEFKILLSRSN